MNLAFVDSARVETLGGIERALADLGRRAQERGHEVCCVGRAGSEFAAHCRSAGLRSLELPLRSDVDPRSIAGLRRLFRSQRTDAAVVTLNRDARLAGLAGALGHRPAIAVLKGLPMMRQSWSHVFTYRHFVDGILAPTTWLKAEVERYPFVRHLPVELLPDGIEEERFPPLDGLAAARAEARRGHGVPGGRAIFMSVGHLVRRKNLLAVPAWLAQLPATADWQWWVAGDGPDESALREAARSHGFEERLRLLGRREDVPSLLLAADALVMPSLEEQLPLAALEARRAGVPHVLVAEVGAEQEMRELGVRVLPLADTHAWVEALSRAARGAGACDVPALWTRGAAHTTSLRLAFLERLAESRRARRPREGRPGARR